jgi:protein arginine N-methyltransferase 1
MEIDLNTLRKEDLAFEAPFKLLSRHDDYIHAVVTFFTVEFSKCHKRTWFSTAPEAPYTHWKQTVFYLNDYATVKKVLNSNFNKTDLRLWLDMGLCLRTLWVCFSQGEEVTGVFSLKQNSRNNRDLDFKVKIDFDGEHSSLHEDNTYRMR